MIGVEQKLGGLALIGFVGPPAKPGFYQVDMK